MTLHNYRTRSTTVAAIQYDGTNLEEINRLLRRAKRAPLADLLEVGAWVIFTEAAFQVLPNSVFKRVYEIAPVVAEVVVDEMEPDRSCYLCSNYAMTNGGVGFCTLFNEGIDSELHAAIDCSGYEPEGS